MWARFLFYERAPSSLHLCCASMQGETWALVLIFILTEMCRKLTWLLSTEKNCVLNWICLKGRETHLWSSVFLGTLCAKSISLCQCSTVVPMLVCLVPWQMPCTVKANAAANVCIQFSRGDAWLLRHLIWRYGHFSPMAWDCRNVIIQIFNHNSNLSFLFSYRIEDLMRKD